MLEPRGGGGGGMLYVRHVRAMGGGGEMLYTRATLCACVLASMCEL